jgi:lysyl-tRNA synthetase class I
MSYVDTRAPNPAKKELTLLRLKMTKRCTKSDGKVHSLNKWKRAFKDELMNLVWFVSRPKRGLEMYLSGGVRISPNVSSSLFFGL